MGCECKQSTHKCSSGCVNKSDGTNNCNNDSDCIKPTTGGHIEEFNTNTHYKVKYFELDISLVRYQLYSSYYQFNK